MNQAEERQTKPVIKTIQATRADIAFTDVSQHAGPKVLAITAIRIIYEDRKRDSLDRMLKGTLLGVGDDFFVMQDGESYLVYDDFVKIISHVPASMGSFDGCKLHGFCLKLGDGTVVVFSKFGQRGIVLPEENLKYREMEMSDNLGTKTIRCPVCNGSGKMSIIFLPEEIKRLAFNHFNMTLPGQLEEACRASMFLCGKLAGSTPEQLAESFDKTHADVMHACKTVEDRMQSEPEFGAKIIRIVHALVEWHIRRNWKTAQDLLL